MNCRLFLDVIVSEGAVVVELLSSEDKALLVRRNRFLVLDLGLEVLDCVSRLHVECDIFPRERSHKNLHCSKKGVKYACNNYC